DRESAVADHDVAICVAAFQVGEERPCDVFDLRIDIEERDVSIGPAPARHAACSQSDHRDVLIRTHTDELHDVTHGSGLVIVGKRLTGKCWILAFQTVKRIAVQKLTHVAVEVENDFLDSEEVARKLERLIIVEETRKSQAISHNQNRQRKSESD